MNSNENLTPQDVSNILSEGVGAPYVAVFDAASNAIIDPSSCLPIGELIDNFVYEYVEEKEDSGSFVITSDNAAICGIAALQYREILWIQWGYLLPNKAVICGTPRQVMITEVNADFSEDRVTLEVRFADSSIRLKNAPSIYSGDDAQFLSDLISAVNGYNISTYIRTYTNNLSSAPYLLVEKQDEPTQTTGQSVVITPTGYDTRNPAAGSDYQITNPQWNHLEHQLNIQPPTEIPEEAVAVNLLKLSRDEAFSQEIQDLIKSQPEKYKLMSPLAGAELDSRLGIATNSPLVGDIITTITVERSVANNLWGQLEEIGKKLPDGPYYMDGRDGQLVLHNMMEDRPTSLIYTWKGGNGELLSFKVSSKFTRSLIEMSSSTDIDPDNKSLISSVVQTHADTSMVNPDVQYMYSDWNYGEPSHHIPTGDDLANSNSDTMAGLSGVNLFRENQVLTQMGTFNYNTDTYHQYHSRMVPRTNASDPVIYTNPGEATTGEKEAYLRDVVKPAWDKHVNREGISTQEELEDCLHNGFSLPTLKIKRVAELVVEAISPESAMEQARWLATAVGQNVISVDGANKVSLTGKRSTSYTPADIEAGYARMEEEALSYKYAVHYTIEESIEGTQVLADTSVNFADALQINNLKEVIRNQVKATATVLGRPSIESSMNLEIHNVSKFSGTWYTKKVIHRINTSNGYTTEIDFIQKNTKVSEIVIDRRQAISKLGQQLNKDTQRAINEGKTDHLNPEYSDRLIESVERKSLNRNALVTQTPEGITVITADQDTQFNTSELNLTDMGSY